MSPSQRIPRRPARLPHNEPPPYPKAGAAGKLPGCLQHHGVRPQGERKKVKWAHLPFSLLFSVVASFSGNEPSWAAAIGFTDTAHPLPWLVVVAAVFKVGKQMSHMSLQGSPPPLPGVSQEPRGGACSILCTRWETETRESVNRPWDLGLAAALG